MSKVISYDTGNQLEGAASDALVRESAEAEPTGAVSAYLDDGTWHYVAADQADHHRKNLHVNVVTVYVEAD